MAYQLVRDFIYDFGQTFKGAAVESTFTFSTPKGPIGGPIADSIISQLEQQCAAKNYTTLRTQVYVDYSPAITTGYLVTFSLYDPGQHSPVLPELVDFLLWLIPYIVATVVVVFLYLTIRTIRDIAYSPSGPALASGLKWFAIGLAVLASGFVIKEVIAAIPARQKAKATT
jgi:hypothetical protein